jgi:hypothetical protein
MAHAHCMLYTLATHTQHVCLFLFPLQQWLYESASMWSDSYITCRVDTGSCWGNLKEWDRPEDKTTIMDRKQLGNRTCDAWLRTGTNDRFHKRSETLHWVTLFKDSVIVIPRWYSYTVPLPVDQREGPYLSPSSRVQRLNIRDWQTKA